MPPTLVAIKKNWMLSKEDALNDLLYPNGDLMCQTYRQDNDVQSVPRPHDSDYTSYKLNK